MFGQKSVINLLIKWKPLNVCMNLTVSRIALVKPDKARGVEDVLLRAAQTGGISEKVIDNDRPLCGFVYPLLVLQEPNRADK